MSADDDTRSPRILVALKPGALRQRVIELLAERDIDVMATPPTGPFEASVDATEADVVIMDRNDLSGGDAARLDEMASDEDGPEIVVLGRELEVGERVDLVSAGAAEVIDIANLGDQAVDAVELLAVTEGSHAAPVSRTGAAPSLADFASHNAAMNELLDLVRRVAPSESTLLITGETGVGKEHMARAIHATSQRAAGPFVAVNCGALASELLESELFGHKAGAFTGAQGDRAGAFQSASGGTLLLDEIGDMPPAMQVKLLRVLQAGEVRPVGADKDVHVDVRVLAATNRDLRAAVQDGSFREDLYFRLNVVEVRIPPLRERREDLATLIGMLLRRYRDQTQARTVPRLEPSALEAMLAYSWPGNVRELTNVVERAALVCRDHAIRPRDLPEHVRAGDAATGGGGSLDALPGEILALDWKQARQEILRRTERAYLDTVLADVEGVVGAAAERAGLAPRSLYEKMKRHGLRKEDYK